MNRLNKAHIKLFFRVLSWMYKKNSDKVFMWDTGYITTGSFTPYEKNYGVNGLFFDLKERGLLVLDEAVEETSYNGRQRMQTGYYVSLSKEVTEVFDREMIEAVGTAAGQSKEHYFFVFNQVSLMLKCFKKNKKGELIYKT